MMIFPPVSRPILLIPARMNATRLPDKPLADIAGKPMIIHVWERALAAQLGPVVVATDSPQIADIVRGAGGIALITRADHPSGSDRIFEAVEQYDPAGSFDAVINVQGDLPTLNPSLIRAAFDLLHNPEVAIGTLAAKITDTAEITNSNVVKVVGSSLAADHLRALYFTRAAAPYGAGDYYHHIGLYAYRRAVLRDFVHMPPSALELREKLEQLRALEAGWRIDVKVVEDVPLGVDTLEDLEKARAFYAQIVWKSAFYA
jgi:3-deoxy-manno-octulosonate cytidylyltransferase (CMP-KDO synthetase)